MRGCHLELVSGTGNCWALEDLCCVVIVADVEGHGRGWKSKTVSCFSLGARFSSSRRRTGCTRSGCFTKEKGNRGTATGFERSAFQSIGGNRTGPFKTGQLFGFALPRRSSGGTNRIPKSPLIFPGRREAGINVSSRQTGKERSSRKRRAAAHCARRSIRANQAKHLLSVDSIAES